MVANKTGVVIIVDGLSKKEKQELILDLVYGFVLCKSIHEAIIFLEDLITKKELETLSKRLRIAKLLLEGYNYRDIQVVLHVSHGTVAKVSLWLSERGAGFRKIIGQLPKKDQPHDPMNQGMWDELKKKYPSYFLPQLVVESILSNRKKNAKHKLTHALDNLEASLRTKRKVHKEISEELYNKYNK